MDACVSTEAVLEYVEGRAAADARARVEAHAAECEECRRVLAALARDASVVAPGEAATVPLSPPKRFAEGSDGLGEGERVGRYVIARRLGAGGMGVVYAAHDPELGRDVAIKLLSPGLGSTGARAMFEERLHREARALAQLAHPNVVTIHDVGRVGERLFIAMELLEGGTLAQWCAAERRTPVELLARFLEAGHGLAAAHAAGLVHRDVKPENMMLGKDGRVRVVDFGLARADAGAGTVPSGSGPLGDSALTAVGAVMGTPHYMAPEQHRGDETDARSDQFAFCIAVYFALFRERPFAGDDLTSLAANVSAGRLREPESLRGVPRRIWRALRRGMAPARADRFGTLDELLRELAPRRRSRWLPATAAAGVIAVATATLVLARTHAEPCTDMASHLVGVWDGPRAARIASALLATGAPGADTAARTVATELDHYSRQWVALREDTCRATRVRGDQPDDVMGLRMACLDDRLRDVDALAGRLEHPDRTTVSRAVTATFALGSLAACADVAALRKVGKPPRDPALVAELRDKLAVARALERAGQVRDGLEQALALTRGIEAIAYRPLEAEHALLVGTLRNDEDATREAITSLDHAVLAAESSGYDRVAAQALIQLVHLRGTHGNFAEADATAARAAAAIERMGGDPGLTADLDYAIAMGGIVRGDLDGASQHLHHALDISQTARQPDEMRIASVLTSLGQVELRKVSGQAKPYLERALAIDERLLGADHPDLAPVHVALGGAAYEHADYDEAAAHYEHAIALLQRAFGRENVQLANALANLALVRQWQGRAPDALVEIQEAVALDDKLLPAGDPQTAAHVVTEADVLEQLDRHADALAAIDRALALLRKLYPGDHQDIADALHSRALVELAAGKPEAALADGQAALAMFHRINPDYPTLELLRTLGKIELARHDPVAAIGYFEDAKRHGKADTEPYNLALLDALTGRALVESGRDRAKGIALVQSAYAALRDDARVGEESSELAQWMRAHGIAPR